jgi:hypothetical protein
MAGIEKAKIPAGFLPGKQIIDILILSIMSERKAARMAASEMAERVWP